jgi:hypothetical protein
LVVPELTNDTTRALKVLVRDVDDPETPIAEARVIISPAADSTRRRVFAVDAQGTALIRDLTPEKFTIRVHRIGYAPAAFLIPVRGVCKEVLELYLGKQAMCLFQCPPTPARAVLTTCPRAA